MTMTAPTSAPNRTRTRPPEPPEDTASPEVGTARRRSRTARGVLAPEIERPARRSRTAAPDEAGGRTGVASPEVERPGRARTAAAQRAYARRAQREGRGAAGGDGGGHGGRGGRLVLFILR